MSEIKAYPAILEPTPDGYSIFFPDLPGAISAGSFYEEAINNAEECLSLHIYGMLKDGEPLPVPTHMSEIIKQLDDKELGALIHYDVFAVKARQEDRAIRVNVTFPKSLLQAIDFRAQQLGIDRSKLLQRAVREII